MPNRAGLKPVPQAFADLVRAETTRRGILLIVDEVITLRLGAVGPARPLRHHARPRDDGQDHRRRLRGRRVGRPGRRDGRARPAPRRQRAARRHVLREPGHLRRRPGRARPARPGRRSTASTRTATGSASAVAALGYNVAGSGSLFRLPDILGDYDAWWRLYHAGMLVATNGLCSLSTVMTEADVEEIAARFAAARAECRRRRRDAGRRRRTRSPCDRVPSTRTVVRIWVRCYRPGKLCRATGSRSAARGSTTSGTSRVRMPRERLVVHHRAVRLGQVVARLRHALRRGPAPLRRVALGLRAAVPRADGEARRRLHRGPVAGHLDRPEDDVAQPALDRRHRHRDLRLPAPAVRAGRAPALPRLRPADRGPVGRADRRPGDGAARRARGSRSTRRSCAAARASSRTCSRASAARASRASSVDGETRLLEEAHRARQEVQARHRGGRRPAGHEGRPAQAPGRLGRDRAGAGRGPRSTSRSSTGETHARYSEKFACPEHGVSLPELAPRVFSFNSPHGACPALPRPRRDARARPRPDRARRRGVDLRRRAAAVERRPARASTRAPSWPSPSTSASTLETPWGELPDEQRKLFLYGTGGQRVLVTYKNRQGRKRQYMMAFEGIIAGLDRRYRETESSLQRERIEEYMTLRPCPTCNGARLQPESLAVTVARPQHPHRRPACRCAARAHLGRRPRA